MNAEIRLGQKSGTVAIVGRPNAGKSTLLNQILGSDLSIVSPKAQTTRERVLGIYTVEGKGQILFSDTPGIHQAREGGVNAFMVDQAKQALDAPEIVWYLVDPRSALVHEEVVIEMLSQASSRSRLEVWVLQTKSDADMNSQLGEQVRQELERRGVSVPFTLSISAKRKINIAELLERTWSTLPEGPLYYSDKDQLSDRPVKFFIGEQIREQLFLQLGDELPYSSAVEVTEFKETTKPIRISATIHVERESQKGMVIGKGGAKIKSIGQAARKKMEDFLGAPVYLGLRVDVLKDWTKNTEALKRMGYVIGQ